MQRMTDKGADGAAGPGGHAAAAASTIMCMQDSERRADPAPALQMTGKDTPADDAGCNGPVRADAYMARPAPDGDEAAVWRFGHMSPLTPPLPGGEEFQLPLPSSASCEPTSSALVPVATAEAAAHWRGSGTCAAPLALPPGLECPNRTGPDDAGLCPLAVACDAAVQPTGIMVEPAAPARLGKLGRMRRRRALVRLTCPCGETLVSGSVSKKISDCSVCSEVLKHGHQVYACAGCGHRVCKRCRTHGNSVRMEEEAGLGIGGGYPTHTSLASQSQVMQSHAQDSADGLPACMHLLAGGTARGSNEGYTYVPGFVYDCLESGKRAASSGASTAVGAMGARGGIGSRRNEESQCGGMRMKSIQASPSRATVTTGGRRRCTRCKWY